MSTINQVAKLAGVSKATVSRVLSGTTPVKEETRGRVLNAVKSLSYSPNQAARSLASNKSYTIGLVTSNIDTAYYGPAASGVERALRGGDRHVIIACGNGSLEGEREAVDFLIKRQVDALVLITNFLLEEEIAQINLRCPVFVLNQTFPGGDDHHISFDNFAGGEMATQYLIDKGHRKIATVTGPLWKYDAYQRYLGCQKALEKAGLDLHFQAEGNFSVESGMSHMRSILALENRPSAIFFANDLMAMGALHVCAQQGIKAPEDVAIIGFDDLDMSQYYSPSITTIKLPLYEMAEATAYLLLNSIYRTRFPVKNNFSPELIPRQSA
ncbi:LacI family DNA-binding transcriptional regulator [Marinomonas sp. M1K-6]|uniref:LacI family DNA-binding transcriptional regulator n=1 Tax=Marinomonas profundi TaxID=2726122 RepID=A0A847RBT6_9GAMM|nr:LacI family DNA-binding transcriptional regulator [Marinomonas profundi]NLQ18727.1 LacI family DNA-binding transcriptional regulator [Marinomonas profundi]UDV04027.1 LacI family DNA-binding transcriptional regulator [Marinomonas profundi]